MHLSSSGRSDVTVHLGSGAGDLECFAASELRKYVSLMSGATLRFSSRVVPKKSDSIILCSGETADKWMPQGKISNRKADSYCIAVTNQQVRILAQNARGLLFAVYALLEKDLGVAFVGPGTKHEYVPCKNELTIKPCVRIEEPSLAYRGYICRLPEEVDWIAKNRMNYPMCQHDGPVYEAAKKRGMIIGGGGHAFYKWCPPEKYWKTHPEYYSLLDGKRICTYEQGEHMGHQQICMTHPDVIRIVADNIIAFCDVHSDHEIIPFWPNDADSFCQCENCLKLDGGAGRTFAGSMNNSASYLYFVNHVAERVSQHHPHVRLATIAYRTTIQPPVEKIDVHPMVLLEIANWGRPSDLPLGCNISRATVKRKLAKTTYKLDPDEMISRPDGYPAMNTSYYHRRYTGYPEIIRGWGEVISGGLVIYEYAMASQSTISQHYPMWRTMLHDQKFYHSNNVVGAYMQAHKENVTAYGLNYWTGAKAYWNGYSDPEKHLADWCQKRYGRALKPMQTFFNILTDEFESIYADFAPLTVSRILTPSVIARCRKALRSAEASAKTDPHRRWVYQAVEHFNYCQRLREYYDACLSARETIVNCEKVPPEKGSHSLDKQTMSSCGMAFDRQLPAIQAWAEVNRKALAAYEQIMTIRGQDILCMPLLVFSVLIQPESFSPDYYDPDFPMGSMLVAKQVADYLLPRHYDGKGW